MAGILFNSNYDNNTYEELLNQLAKAWFSQTYSTVTMITSAKNEGVLLKAFSKLSCHKHLWDWFVGK